jgi:hypothetical protein
MLVSPDMDAHASMLSYFKTQEEAMAAGAKPKVKKPAGKAGKGKNDLAELEAQLAAMEMEKKKKAERAKAEKAAAAKVGKGCSFNCVFDPICSSRRMRSSVIPQAAKKKVGGSDDDYSSDDSGLPPLEANPNRANADVEAARTVEAAIDLLGGSEYFCISVFCAVVIGVCLP